MKDLSKAHIILDCCYHLSNCICFDNIENTEYIEREVSQIKKLCSLLPKEIANKIKNYISENISPLLQDDFWINRYDSNCGHLDEEKNCWAMDNEQEFHNVLSKVFEVITYQENKLNQFEQELVTSINKGEITV